jgi:DNA-binding transcriptional MerR regulator
MKIGELAERTGVATRLIRYYEQQGLLEADRLPNGYRTYREEHVEQVERVAGLIQSGIPTRLVKALLEAEAACAKEAATCSRELATLLAAELEGLEKRITCLTRSRDTIRQVLARTATPA